MLDNSTARPGSQDEAELGPFAGRSCTDDDESDAFEMVFVTLTFPLWTFITFFILLLLIHYTNFKKPSFVWYDPSSISNWPTYTEILLIIFYLWCAALCFGYLIPVKALLSSVTLHAFTVSFISWTSAVVISFVYLRLIKYHIVDQHYKSNFWRLVQGFMFCLIMVLSFGFWSLSTGQLNACRKQSIEWLISCVSSGAILTAILFITYFFFKYRKQRQDEAALNEGDANLMRTNDHLRQQPADKRDPMAHKSNQTKAGAGSSGSGPRKSAPHGKKKPSESKEKGTNKEKKDRTDDTLDNGYVNSSGVYIKTKNRNSISQYI